MPTVGSDIGTYVIGMMSGTSLDAIDAVLAHYTDTDNLNKPAWQVICHTELPIPIALKQQLYQLNFPNCDNQYETIGGELHLAKTAEQQLTHCYAEAYHQLMSEVTKSTHISTNAIIGIAAHGQTIRHNPNADYPYTVQLLNGALLSHLTGQTVICDFRSKDIAAGGQGAPLAPIFHQELFQCQMPFAVINIGGIANVSLITEKEAIGFDCGTGNCLMDEWIFQHQGKSFDKNGEWASTGKVLPDILSTLLTDEYFSKKIPKSTGRDYFNREWLEKYLSGNESPEDVMRTLLMLTAKGITDSLPTAVQTVILAGGGAKNNLLVQEIKDRLLVQTKVLLTDDLGINTQHVEALGFAILGKYCLDGTPIDTGKITGAKEPVICGAIYR
ncbi:MAG: anhydro-N-acetylmuramic acid kinase [Gammaproteobacteria bacterium]|nr:anhydro-N-acetylmuramic acid kinase [Gammaproteobacteria bacterium]